MIDRTGQDRTGQDRTGQLWAEAVGAGMVDHRRKEYGGMAEVYIIERSGKEYDKVIQQMGKRSGSRECMAGISEADACEGQFL